MKHHCLICSTLVLIAACAAMAQAPDLGRMDIVERSVPDGPVAMVDGSPVSSEDFLFLYRSQLSLVTDGGQQPLDDRTRWELAVHALTEVLQREVLYQEALRRGFSVTDDALNENYQRRLRSLQERFTAQGEAPPTEAEILAQSGQSPEEARESMRKIMLVNQAFDAITKESDAAVTDAEVTSFYRARPELFERPDRMHLRQIFVRPKAVGREADEAAWEEAKSRIDRARARIRAGESFETVARNASDAPDREQGGDMGPIPTDGLPPFYAEPAAKMNQGDISDVIRSPHGFHLIQLISHEAGDTAPLEEVLEDIRAVLREAKTDNILERFCAPILGDTVRTRVFLQIDPSILPPETQAPQSSAASPSPAAAAGAVNETPPNAAAKPEQPKSGRGKSTAKKR